MVKRSVGKAGAGGLAALAIQGGLTLVTLGAVALAPPARGAMLVVPVTGTPAKPWLDRRDDIRFAGPGTLSGSIVVVAERNALIADAIAHGALLLPASPSLCATRRTDAA